MSGKGDAPPGSWWWMASLAVREARESGWGCVGAISPTSVSLLWMHRLLYQRADLSGWARRDSSSPTHPRQHGWRGLMDTFFLAGSAGPLPAEWLGGVDDEHTQLMVAVQTWGSGGLLLDGLRGYWPGYQAYGWQPWMARRSFEAWWPSRRLAITQHSIEGSVTWQASWPSLGSFPIWDRPTMFIGVDAPDFNLGLGNGNLRTAVLFPPSLCAPPSGPGALSGWKKNPPCCQPCWPSLTRPGLRACWHPLPPMPGASAGQVISLANRTAAARAIDLALLGPGAGHFAGQYVRRGELHAPKFLRLQRVKSAASYQNDERLRCRRGAETGQPGAAGLAGPCAGGQCEIACRAKPAM